MCISTLFFFQRKIKSIRTKGTFFQSTIRSNNNVSILESMVINDGSDMDGNAAIIEDGENDDNFIEDIEDSNDDDDDDEEDFDF
mmetsp:Transcript_6167/g.9340  ORF Transcript_6167/g.9340 Transcript_6167/m.9340 type:complete len:84 (-) Transcript_6167:171-422(-)